MKALIPWHWALGLVGKTVPAKQIFLADRLNVRGGHVSTLRRLFRFGPWGFYVVRYRAGHVGEDQ